MHPIIFLIWWIGILTNRKFPELMDIRIYRLIPVLASTETAIMSTEPAAHRRLPLLPVKSSFLKRVNLSQLLQRVIPAGKDGVEQATEIQRSKLPSPLHQPRRSSKTATGVSPQNPEPLPFARTVPTPEVASTLPMSPDRITSDEQMVCKHRCTDLTVCAVLMMGVRRIMPGGYLNTYVKTSNPWML